MSEERLTYKKACELAQGLESAASVYWPSGNSTFPGLYPDIIRLLTEGVVFLGTPVWGTDSSYVADIIWKVKTTSVRPAF